MGRKIFISHKSASDSNDVGIQIQKYLKSKGHDSFFDKDILTAGMLWENRIINDLVTSDVIIVIIEEATGVSDWVQREVDMARALNISILPVALGNSYDTLVKVIERLNIKNIQMIQIKGFNYQEFEAKLLEIESLIEPLSIKTSASQMLAWEEWNKRRQPAAPKIEQNPRLQGFKLARAANISFYLATGDATELEGYDVLVNTENDYMQMARFFEMNTLSAAIRWKGARFGAGNKLRHDTVQEQLYTQVKNMGIDSLPVGEGFVVPTFAGDKGSKLRDLGYEFILHAATVQINRTKRTIKSLPIEASVELIKNCLDEVQKIDRNKGAILYNSDGEPMPSEEYAGIKTILFPVFGAGQGGNSLEDAVRGMLKGFKEYFARPKQLPLEEIGLCIYNAAHAEIVQQIFVEEGFEPI